MIEKVPRVGPSGFPSDNVAPLARALNQETQSFITQLRSANVDLAKLATTIIALSERAKEAEQC